MDAALPGSSLWLAAGAGAITVASPCVLPVLPALLGAAWGGANRWRPVWVVLGFIGSFAGLALALSSGLAALGLGGTGLRAAAAAGLLLSGLLMAWPRLGDAAGRLLQPLAQWGHRAAPRASHVATAGLLSGAALGAVWAPCAGPALAAVLSLLAQGGTRQAAPLLLAYGTGAGLPMLAIAWGGQAASTRVRALARHAGRIRRGFGVLVVAVAAATLLGRDAQLAALTSGWLPTGAGLPAQPDSPVGRPAPEFTGLTAWLNTPEPLTLAGLRGRPVLIDFWTWNCVNCIRTLPHIQRLHERHAAQGLVVIGVHTPEFAHERSLQGLRAAIRRHGLRYPIAQDNGYATWSAWRNAYWPAVYLIDGQGRVVYHHVGEGGHAELEARIERLLQGARPGMGQSGHDAPLPGLRPQRDG